MNKVSYNFSTTLEDTKPIRIEFMKALCDYYRLDYAIEKRHNLFIMNGVQLVNSDEDKLADPDEIGELREIIEEILGLSDNFWNGQLSVDDEFISYYSDNF